jgi:aspartyl-tRNA(Asn)/glutamyl-tRNA(Gln) amidotransferase subunit A
MSVPFGSGDDGMPVGVQVLAPARGEAVMFRVGAALEALAPGPTGVDAVRSRREAVR